MDRKITVNINLEPEILKHLFDLVESGKFESRSEAVRHYIHLGFQMEQLNGLDINDPEFLQKVKSILTRDEKTDEDPALRAWLIEIYKKIGTLKDRKYRKQLFKDIMPS